jgi:glycosyltransferase involved in cell wall biosynthesis
MKIAIIAPVEETVPPRAYGGIEHVVHLLEHDLATAGHDVTLLASGGSSATGRLVTLTDGPLGVPGTARRVEQFRVIKQQAALRAARVIADEQPDIVLNHTWRAIEHLGAQPALTTIHYPLDHGEWRAVFAARSAAAYVSISYAQRRQAPALSFAGNVYNGIAVESFPFADRGGAYLAFLGRACPEKGLDLAIVAAQRAGMPLRAAAKVDESQRRWFDAVIEPLIRRGHVEFIGEISSREKGAFLAGAAGLLHPSRWSEPFGLAMVEAMACGTPVIALDRGAVSEIVEDARTGFIVEDEDGLAAAVGRLVEIERSACRNHVLSRFDRRQMCAGYEKLATNACQSRRFADA